MASASAEPQTPKAAKAIRKQDVAKLAERNDRFEILKNLFPRVSIGTMWFSDTKEVGPANIEKCKLPLEVWIERMKSYPDDGRCKGQFLSSFGRVNSSRRCERVASAKLCGTCLAMITVAKIDNACISVKDQNDYIVIKKSLFKRSGVTDNMAFWDKASKERKEKHKLDKNYPYFSAKEIIDMVLIESLTVFKDGGNGGRIYRRSAVIVEAQDEFLKICLSSILTILRFEQKMHFMKRWKVITKVAARIHGVMMVRAQELDKQVGAIQAADVVREELIRAAQFAAKEHQTARHLSLRIKRLFDWAKARRGKQTSPVSSVSSSSPPNVPPSNPKRSKTPIPLKKVDIVKGKKANGTEMQNEEEVFEPRHKSFIIKQSTISEAGQGLFITEHAKDKEQIFRYSGKVISKAEAVKSDSQYILKISENVYLDGRGKDEWEGNKANCARKAGRQPNARFGAARKYNICKKTSRCWVPMFAVGNLKANESEPEEIVVDYGSMYWPRDEGEPALPSPVSPESESVDNDRASDSDFHPTGKVPVGMVQRKSKRIAKADKRVPQRKRIQSTPVKSNPRPVRLRDDGRDDMNDPVQETHVEEDPKPNVSPNGIEDEENNDEADEGKKDEEDNDQENDENEDDDELDNEENDEEEGIRGKEDDEDMGYGSDDRFRHNKRSPTKSSGVYAVIVGRCVGIFKSGQRVLEVTNKFPNRAVRKFKTVQEAEIHLKEIDLRKPIQYWKLHLESGSLLESPQAVIGKKVCFPVGLDMESYRHRGWGVVVETMIAEDKRMWRVELANGFYDRMSEWPLLCGLRQYRQVFGDQVPRNPITSVMRKDDRSRLSHTFQRARQRTNYSGSIVESFNEGNGGNSGVVELETFFAIRGGSRDGVTTDSAEVPMRMTGEAAEFEEFDSREKAEAWVQAIQFFTVKDSAGQSRVMQLRAFLRAAKGQKGWTVVGPNTKAVAVKILQEWSQADALKDQLNRRDRIGHQEKYIDLVNDKCIARMSDGSECGRTFNVKLTSIGPLCGEHASRWVERDPESNKGADMDNSQQNLEVVHADVSKVSPADSIQMPDKKMTIKRSKQQKVSVIALRTFPDAEYQGVSAGSIWLSMDDAEEANVKGGEIKCFSRHKSIFENIAEAREWISDQEGDLSEGETIEAEFDRLVQEAREKRQTESSRGSNTDRNNRARGRGRGNRGGGRGRGGRGGRGSRGGRGRKTTAARKSKDFGHSWTSDNIDEIDENDEDDDEYGEDGSEDDDKYGEDEEPRKGARGARFRRRQRRRGGRKDRRGGLRSGASVLLDKEQSRVEKQLFHDDAEMVLIYDFEVPEIQKCVKIPLPGKAGALTTSKDAKHVLSFGNNMEAVLAEKTFKSFKAFSLSELMEFQQLVQYVAQFQPKERQDVTDSVVEATNVIAANAIRTYGAMRDADGLGPNGENFKAYTYLQVMYMVMFREAFEGALSDIMWWDYAKKFAIKARGSPGMGLSRYPNVADSEPKVGASERCLFCGKAGHRASSNIHKHEMAEGGAGYSQENLSVALANITKDDKLTAELKKRWSGRIKAFWAKMQNGTEDITSSSH